MDVNQNKGSQPGIGESASVYVGAPPSGAGAGYWGGTKGTGDDGPTSYKAASKSGSSYISGYSDCSIYNNNGIIFKFTKPKIMNGFQEFPSPLGFIEKGHSFDGAVKFTLLSNLLCIQKISLKSNPFLNTIFILY